jgi:hypothetical protein
MPKLVLDWATCDNGWCSFNDVDLGEDRFTNLSGVYIIFYMDGSRPKTISLGTGEIANRFADHRNDKEITRYGDAGLLVTWAEVPANQQEGVERFLALALQPMVGDRFPDRVPIQVNLPF